MADEPLPDVECRLVTGQTQEEFKAQVHLERHLQETGQAEEGYRGRCYLCRRTAGEQGVVFVVRGDEMVPATGPVQIMLVEVAIRDEEVMAYPVCHECAVLLKGFAGSYPITVRSPTDDS
ncbi:MAG: hypothetical protein AB1505_32920 [Candidatus Latescibacterota bacterium]